MEVVVVNLLKVIFAAALVEAAAPDGTFVDGVARDTAEVAAFATFGAAGATALGASAVGTLTVAETGAVVGAVAGTAKVALD